LCVCVRVCVREMIRVEIKKIKVKEHEMLCDSFK